MQVKLRLIQQTETSGIIQVLKEAGEELRKIGEVKYQDESEKKWLLHVLMSDHPYVSLLQ